MADEALASFQSLLESVPGWISELETILTTATTQQSVLAAEHAVQTTNEQSQIRFDFLRMAQRKRKSASVCSKAESRSSEVSKRQCLATIYYDGNTQKRFESLVRGIGSKRNGIRKGKLSMKLDSFSRTGSSSSECSEGEETIKGLGTFRYRTTTTFRRPDSDGVKAFDDLDRALERAQLSCEKAAHAILRDGDCSNDIRQARQQFDAALVTIKAELPSLTAKAEKAARRRMQEQYSDDEASTTRNSDGISLPSDGILEVDTDEQSGSDGEDFNISSMKLPPQLSKSGTMRSSPLQTRIIQV